MPQYQGVWSLQQQMQALTSGQWATDPLFDYTTLLLQADNAANSAQNNTFLDSSTNAFAITRNGNTTQGSFSPFAQAPGYWGNYFDGSSLLTVPANNAFVFGTGDFTIELWIYQTAAWSTNNIINNVSSGNTSWSIDLTAGNIYFSGWNTTFLNGGTQPSINAWHHIAVCRSGTTLSMFIDGIRTGTTTNSTNFSSNNTLSIGGFSGFYYTTGYLSNVRLVKGTAVYNPSSSTCAVPTSPLTAISGTSVLTCQNNRFIDNSSNAFVVSVGGGTPSVQAFSPFAPQFQYTASGTGGSGYFDGTTDYLTAGTTSNFNFLHNSSALFTIEGWVYASSFASAVELFGTNSGTSNEVGTVFSINSSSQLRLLIGRGVSASPVIDATSTGTVSLNQWVHVAVTYDQSLASSNCIFYINGVSSGTVNKTANAPSSSSSAYPGTINAFGTSSGGACYLSGIRVNNSIVYTSAFTPPTAPLTAIANTQLLLNFTNAGILDGTMKNNLETVGNASVSTSVVKYGSGSMYFDGTGDSLSAPNSVNYQFGSGDFTIEAWVNFSSVSGEKGIVSYFAAGTPNAGFTLRLSTGNSPSGLRFVASGASDVVLQAAWTPSTNTWYHVAVVRLNNTLTAYINGVSIGSTSITITIGAPSAVLAVGTAQTVASSDMNGYIDDLRITKGIARYTQNFIPPSVALPRQ